MAVSQFSTVDMIPAMEALAPPETFLNTTFFGRTSFFTGRFAQVDTRRARRWLAPVVKRNQVGRVISREPITTKFFEVPEVRGIRETSVADLDDRLLGESAYSRRTSEERLAEIVAAALVDLVGAVTRRIEQMTASLLFNGSFSYLLDDGSVETLTYGTVTPVVPPVLWDATSGSDPIKDLSAAASTIVANSGLQPDVAVFGEQALSVFLNNATVQEQLNKLHLVVGGISPTAPENVGSAQFIGRLYRPFVSVYGYNEQYEDESSNVLKPMIDPKTVLLGCSKSPATTAFGAVTQIEQNGETRSYSDLKFVPRRLAEPREDRVELRVASRPCLVPFDMSSWAVVKPLSGALMTRDEGGEREARDPSRRERK